MAILRIGLYLNTHMTYAAKIRINFHFANISEQISNQYKQLRESGMARQNSVRRKSRRPMWLIPGYSGKSPPTGSIDTTYFG